MKDELEKQIIDIAPYMFRYEGWDNVQHSLMYFGMEVGDGWFKILKDLVTDTDKLDKEKRIRVQQVKEKFGSLRWYFNIESSTDEKIIAREKKLDKINHIIYKIWSFVYYRLLRRTFWFGNAYAFGWRGKVDRLVRKAENKSFVTCEICGNPGKPNDHGWITTLCDSCRIKKD